MYVHMQGRAGQGSWAGEVGDVGSANEEGTEIGDASQVVARGWEGFVEAVDG